MLIIKNSGLVGGFLNYRNRPTQQQGLYNLIVLRAELTVGHLELF